VLDLTVPDAWQSTPTRLRDTLCRLPRLRHLHVTLACGAAQLPHLTALGRLKTLAIDYGGPPALKPGLRARLEAGLPATKVQVWEQLRARGCSSFGGAGAEGEGGAGGLWRAVGRRAVRAVVVVAVLAGGAAVALGLLRRRAAWRAGGFLNLGRARR
ncbi:hypothetical protein MNEG_13033, partial [Monoraphidium neglectum]